MYTWWQTTEEFAAVLARRQTNAIFIVMSSDEYKYLASDFFVSFFLGTLDGKIKGDISVSFTT